MTLQEAINELIRRGVLGGATTVEDPVAQDVQRWLASGLTVDEMQQAILDRQPAPAPPPAAPTAPSLAREVGQPGVATPEALAEVAAAPARAEAIARFEAAYGGQYIGTPQLQADGSIIAVLLDGSQARFVPAGDTYALAPKEQQPGNTPSAPRTFAPQATAVEIDPRTGEIIFIDPNTRSVSRSGQFIQPQGTQVTDPRTGNLLIIGADGSVTDTGQQVGFAETDPNIKQVTDERTGITYNVNTRTGERTPIGTFGFASIDPERDFAENQRQFDVSESGFNRRAGLSAATTGFQSVNTLAPQLGDLALANAGFTRDVLRTPADFVARSFMTRGENSPLPEVSQADVINLLSRNIGQFNDVLSGFSAPAPLTPGGFTTTEQTPTGALPRTEPEPKRVETPAAAFAPVGGTDLPNAPASFIRATGDLGSGAGTNVSAADRAQVAGFAPDDQNLQRILADMAALEQRQRDNRATIAAAGRAQGMAGGGMMQGMAVVGDNKGGTKKKPELVIDMGNAGFMVLNEDQLGFNPEKMMSKRAVPGAATGGFFGFSAPQLPNPGTITQQEIIAARNRARPPAIRDIRAGKRPAPLQFGAGFALPTPGLLNSLTDDERDAFRTDLAVDNISLDDVEFAVRQRFSPQPTRGTARTIGFAA